MKSLGGTIKSFFVESKERTNEEDTPDAKGELYVVKLEEEFKEQFPLNLKSYIQVDTTKEKSYTLTDNIYKGFSYGYKVLLTESEANDVLLELNTVPLELVLITQEEGFDENV